MVAKYETFEDYVDKNLPKLEEKIRIWRKQNFSSELGNLRSKFVFLSQNDPAITILSNGIYTAHIKKWQELFDESSLKIVDGGQFLKDPGSIVEELQDFIGIPKVLLREDFVRRQDNGFFCYRQFKMHHLRNETAKADSNELKCLEDTKGRTRNDRKKGSKETTEKLRKFYRTYNRQFYEDVGVDFNWP